MLAGGLTRLRSFLDLLFAVAGPALLFHCPSALPPGLDRTGKVTSSSSTLATAGKGGKTPFGLYCGIIAAPIKDMDKEEAETFG